ncbi:hypothetical protein CPB86DRAFT_383668 [Serendipita vermifera]|nr:hypothetical protein CPB86DRAFT_383668 [Serendipita vermifera]
MRHPLREFHTHGLKGLLVILGLKTTKSIPSWREWLVVGKSQRRPIPEVTFSFAPNEHFNNVELNGPRGVRISYCQTLEMTTGPHSLSVHREEWLWAASCLRGYLGTKDAQSSYAKTPDGPTCPRNHAVNALYRVSLPPVGLCPVLWRGSDVAKRVL